jgi:hypothetical protein
MSHYHLPIADMMSGLMMVFLFIAVVFMVDVNQAKDKVDAQFQRLRWGTQPRRGLGESCLAVNLYTGEVASYRGGRLLLVCRGGEAR